MARSPIVLIVEDEPDIAALLRELLEGDGFVVLTAANGAHALEVLRVCEPALIVTDMMMPVMDGFAFLAAYSALPLPRAPVIATSSLREYLRVALEQGAIEAYDKADAFDTVPRRAREIVFGGARSIPSPPPPPMPEESRRLRAILDLRLDQPAPGEALRRFTEHLARVFEVPICLFSIVTRDRQYWTAHCGLPPDLEAARGTPREHSFCTHAVVGRTALIVQDAAESPFFKDNILVRERGLRFYAGVPVTTRAGDVVGSLCLLDFRARVFSHFDIELLALLAKRAMAELDWRERHDQPDAPFSTFRYLSYYDEELGILGREAFLDVLRVQACRAISRRAPLSAIAIAMKEPYLVKAARALEEAFPRGHVGRLGHTRLGVIAPDVLASDAERITRGAVQIAAVVEAADIVPPVHAVDYQLEQIEVALEQQSPAP